MAKGKTTDEAAENARVMDSAAEVGATPEDVKDGTIEGSASGQDENNGVESNERREQSTEERAKDAQAQNEEPQEQALESISVLSAKHRLPNWQTAALLRLMDWEDDVMVSDEEFRTAIALLHSRRIGGGRVA